MLYVHCFTPRRRCDDGKSILGGSEESWVLVLPLPHADGMLMFHSSDKKLLNAAVSDRVMDTGKDSLPSQSFLVESKAEMMGSMGSC